MGQVQAGDRENAAGPGRLVGLVDRPWPEAAGVRDKIRREEASDRGTHRREAVEDGYDRQGFRRHDTRTRAPGMLLLSNAARSGVC